MRTHTIHIALSQVGETQVIIGGGLTAKAAKLQAAKSLHPLVQVVTARIEASAIPHSLYAVMIRDDEAVFFDRVSLVEPELSPGESVKRLAL